MKSAWNGGDAMGIEIGLVGHGCNEGDMVYNEKMYYVSMFVNSELEVFYQWNRTVRVSNKG